MIEVRFHGRGGQGTVVASIILARALFESGFYVQSFPLFGVERRGAPVEAYLRWDKRKVLIRANVYTPDHVVVMDRTLLQNIDVTRGLKPEGWILINAPEYNSLTGKFTGYRVACVDATQIARHHGLGTRTHPIVNTAMVGAFARVFKTPDMEVLKRVIAQEITVKPDKNIDAALEAFERVITFNQ